MYFPRSHLEDALVYLVKSDYPEQWPGLEQKIQALFNSPDQNAIFAGLIAYEHLLRKSEFSHTRDAVETVVSQTFPYILDLLKYLLTLDDLKSQEMIFRIIKCFCSATQHTIPTYLMQEGVLNSWMEAIFSVFTKHLPFLKSSMEPNKKVMFRQKKYIAIQFMRYANRFTRSDIEAPETNINFGNIFLERYGNQFTEIALNTLMSYTNREIYCRDNIIALLLHYLGDCIRLDPLWAFLQQHIPALFVKVIVPLASFNEHDVELFNEDPREYISLEYDVTKEYYSSRVPSLSLIFSIIKKRDPALLDSVMEFVLNTFSSYDPNNVESCYLKVGAIRLMGALKANIIGNPKYDGSLEEVLVNFIHTDFQNPNEFVRSKSVWLLGCYAGIPYGSFENYKSSLNYVLTSLNDTCLPIAMEAAFAFKSFAGDERAIPLIEPILSTVVQKYFDLMNTIDNNNLVLAFETLIHFYGPSMSSYALDLLSSLSQHFLRLLIEYNSNRDDDQSIITASNLTSTLLTILMSIRKKKEMFISVQECLYPVIIKALSFECVEYISDLVKLTTEITYNSPKLTPDVWVIFDQMHAALLSYASDDIDEIISVFDNIIAFDTETFLANGRLEKIFSLYKHYIADERRSEHDAAYACQILEIVMLFCKGRIDHAIEPFLELTINRIPNCKHESFKVFLIEVVMNCILNNPTLSLQYLESRGVVGDILYLICNFAENNAFTRVYDKRNIVFGLSTLLELNTLPKSITDNIRLILNTVLNMIVLSEQQKENESDEEEEEELDYANYFDEEGEFDMDEDIEALLKSYESKDGSGWNLNKFAVSELPTDTVEESVYFVERFQQFVKQHQFEVQILSSEEQALLQQVIDLSNRK